MMKPNDKAYQAAILAIKENGPYYAGSKIRESMAKHLAEVALPAAYAAQFNSEDYAELVARLKQRGEWTSDKIWESEPDCHEAADALEAVLAERDALKAANNELREENELVGKQMDRFADQIEALENERDALAARLAPVDDDALVEIAAVAIRRNKFERTGRLDCFDPSNLTPEELGEGRAAIAAIRPHIEADIADKFINPTPEMIAAAWAVFKRDKHKSIGPGPGFVEAMKAMAAAAIRSGK